MSDPTETEEPMELFAELEPSPVHGFDTYTVELSGVGYYVQQWADDEPSCGQKLTVTLVSMTRSQFREICCG